MSNNQQPAKFFTRTLAESDPEISTAIKAENKRQKEQIELIASENMVSQAVIEAQGSILTNKYAEGYPGRRYYGGCLHVDTVEELARERAKRLFECRFVNVQPHSGSQANQAAFMSLIKPGDPILGMSLDAGGHLTHGAPPNQSGKWFDASHYGVGEQDGMLDMQKVADLAKSRQPALIIAGGSAYSRIIDFAAFRSIADETGAYLMVDMAHFSGLVAAGLYPSPLPHAHIVTTTTHKTLRGPRGGMILTNDPDIAKKINSSIFPGIQGGPLMHVIAAKAVALKEALHPEFKDWAKQVVLNAKILAKTLNNAGMDIVSGGTDTHLMLVDLQRKNVTGLAAEQALEIAGITCNKNGVPFDPEKPSITSGIRLGSPAATTRGFKESEFIQIGQWIAEIVDALACGKNIEATSKNIRKQVQDLCDSFPVYN